MTVANLESKLKLKGYKKGWFRFEIIDDEVQLHTLTGIIEIEGKLFNVRIKE